jgi:hypothetical protein
MNCVQNNSLIYYNVPPSEACSVLLECWPVCSLCDLWVLGTASIYSELATWIVCIYQKFVLSYETYEQPLAAQNDYNY